MLGIKKKEKSPASISSNYTDLQLMAGRLKYLKKVGLDFISKKILSKDDFKAFKKFVSPLDHLISMMQGNDPAINSAQAITQVVNFVKACEKARVELSQDFNTAPLMDEPRVNPESMFKAYAHFESKLNEFVSEFT